MLRSTVCVRLPPSRRRKSVRATVHSRSYAFDRVRSSGPAGRTSCRNVNDVCLRDASVRRPTRRRWEMCAWYICMLITNTYRTCVCVMCMRAAMLGHCLRFSRHPNSAPTIIQFSLSLPFRCAVILLSNNYIQDVTVGLTCKDYLFQCVTSVFFKFICISIIQMRTGYACRLYSLSQKIYRLPIKRKLKLVSLDFVFQLLGFLLSPYI